ncbi:hypothetical protein H1D32_24130 [Anaerobacillus sp. CMMVII]|uniref:hypothetical protein n=1 Tax=Anaerobacillus sp. CMMVII TaxID=2755588 RepID=UPI0021B83727|nr:hypothetical protein [Anaerobacillus sp. CMMVII]MCT8140489.1 hypothetical protein [Anaerobacillus sp. CMMVII]
MRNMYIRYMDSPFALGDDKLAAERNELLRAEGIIYQYPYIEAMPPFKSSNMTLRDVCNNEEWPDDLLILQQRDYLAMNFRSIYTNIKLLRMY